jgi:hypothetical protein
VQNSLGPMTVPGMICTMEKGALFVEGDQREERWNMHCAFAAQYAW